MKAVTAKTMRELDSRTIDILGIPGIVLMEAAGRGCAREGLALLGQEAPGKKVLVFSGPGNNGGDGFVVARHLSDAGAEVLVAVLADPTRYKGDALRNYQVLSHFPVAIRVVVDEKDLSELRSWAQSAPVDLVVDALFGTGLVREVGGIYAQAIELANGLQGAKLAVDIPSGICSDTGRVLGKAFCADTTVTFGAPKIGHYLYPGRAHTGRLVVEPIGIPGFAIERAEGCMVTDDSLLLSAFPKRPADSHKGTFGHVLVVGGFRGKGGAALLAAVAASRCGAGLVTVGTDEAAQAHLEGRNPEIMVDWLATVQDEKVTLLQDRAQNLLKGKTSLVVGPGIGQMPDTEAVVEAVLGSGLPATVDADALNLVAAGRVTRELLRGKVVTPHPGEASRLLGRPTREVQNDRLGAAKDLASGFQCVCVLKGASTVVAGSDGRMAICPAGGPELATAGSGDVLSGCIAALLARGMGAFEAACAATHLHGRAGGRVAMELGQHSPTAADLLWAIPEILKDVG